ncbi:unnamed protein product [Chrysoparadoxa australica]
MWRRYEGGLVFFALWLGQSTGFIPLGPSSVARCSSNGLQDGAQGIEPPPYPDATERLSLNEVSIVKNQLLMLSAMSDRGQLCSPQQKEDVEDLVARLQEVTPMGALPKNRDMTGSWTLVYSSSQAFRSSPFFASLQALLGNDNISTRLFSLTSSLPAARVGQCQQIIDEEGTRMVSRVEILVFPYKYLKGYVETKALILNDDIAQRLEVLVESSGITESTLGKLSPRLENWSVPLDWISERFFDKIPKVTLENLYLDKEMRITRQTDDTLLIYVKDQ